MAKGKTKTRITHNTGLVRLENSDLNWSGAMLTRPDLCTA